MAVYRLSVWVLFAVVGMLPPLSFVHAADEPEGVVTFDKLQTVLKKRCTSCHGGNEPRSGLDLTTLAGLKAGSESGPVVVAGKPEESLLYTLTAHLEGPKMPPGKDRIPSQEIKVFHDWIAGGMLERPGSKPKPKVPGSASENRLATDTHPTIVAVTPLKLPTALTALAVDPAGETIAVSGIQQVVLLDSQTHLPKKAFPFPEGDVFALKFSRDGSWLVAGGGRGGASGKVVLFEVATGKRILEAPEERDTVLCVDITADNKYLAWGGPWKTIKVLNISKENLVSTLAGPTDWVLSVGFSPDGRLVAGSDRFGGLRIWKVSDGKEFLNLRGHTGAVPKFVWSPNSDHLLSVGDDATARVWDLHTGEATATWELKLGGLWAADWHQSNVIAIGGRNKKAILLNPAGKLLHELTLKDEATKVVFTTDGSQLLVADAAGQITPFTVINGQPAKAFSLPIAEPLAQIDLPWPGRTRPVKEVRVTAVESVSAEDELLQAVQDAEESLKTAEAALVKLRESAARLRKSLSERSR